MDNTMENNINSIVDDAEEQEWEDRNSESVTMNRNIFTDVCQSPSIFIFLIIIAIIPSEFICIENKTNQNIYSFRDLLYNLFENLD